MTGTRDRNGRRRWTLGLAAVCLAGLVGIGAVVGATSAIGMGRSGQRAPYMAASTATPIALTADQRTCLQQRGEDSAFPRMPPDKQKDLLQRLQRCVDGLHQAARPIPHPLLPPIPTFPPGVAQSPSHRAAGSGNIVESDQAALPGLAFLGQNYWVEVVNPSTAIVAYAGQDRNDLLQGVVVVVATHTPPVTYPTPAKAGAVHVVDASGERLTLQAASGATFIFDVASRTYLPPATR